MNVPALWALYRESVTPEQMDRRFEEQLRTYWCAGCGYRLRSHVSTDKSLRDWLTEHLSGDVHLIRLQTDAATDEARRWRYALPAIPVMAFGGVSR